MSRLSLIGAWLAVTLVATLLTWQIVSAADEEVNDRPVVALQVSSTGTVAEPGSPTSTGSSTTTGPAPTTSTPPQAGTGGPPGNPSNTSTTTSTSSTSTTVSDSSTPTVTTVPTTAWQVETIPTAGGTVVVAYRPGEVRLESASPAPGFSAEVDKQGPPVAEVEFEGLAGRIRVRAEWSDGGLKVDVDSDSVGDG